MPSTSVKQHRFMQAVAHSPSFAKKAGVSQSVGKDFSAADKGKTFNRGGMMKKGKRFNGEDNKSEVEYHHDYDPDKTYSGLFTDDETGGLAENMPTRAYKPEKRETEATPSRATSARAPASAASKAAPKADPEADFGDVYSGSSTSRADSTYRFRPITNDAEAAKARAAGVSSSTPPTVFSREAKTERADKLKAELEELDRDAGKSSGAKKPEPLSNAEIFALGSAIAGTSAVAAAGLSKLAGKKAGAIGKIIEKFTSKGSKTPEPQVIRSNRPSANAKPEITILSEEKKLAELASSAAREKAAGAATPRRFPYQTDKIQIPRRTLPDTIAERTAAAKARAPTGDRDRFPYQTDKIQTPKKTLPDTIAERAKTIAERAPTGGGRIQTPTRNLSNTLAERAAEAAERSKARGGRIVRMASGGSVSAASSRADGIAQRGKTKFRIY